MENLHIKPNDDPILQPTTLWVGVMGKIKTSMTNCGIGSHEHGEANFLNHGANR